MCSTLQEMSIKYEQSFCIDFFTDEKYYFELFVVVCCVLGLKEMSVNFFISDLVISIWIWNWYSDTTKLLFPQICMSSTNE